MSEYWIQTASGPNRVIVCEFFTDWESALDARIEKYKSWLQSKESEHEKSPN